MFICAACLSKRRKTILSPYDEGNVETLTSIFLSPSDNETLFHLVVSLLSEISKPRNNFYS